MVDAITFHLYYVVDTILSCLLADMALFLLQAVSLSWTVAAAKGVDSSSGLYWRAGMDASLVGTEDYLSGRGREDQAGPARRSVAESGPPLYSDCRFWVGASEQALKLRRKKLARKHRVFYFWDSNKQVG